MSKYKTKFDTRGASEWGVDGEAKFVSACESKGYSVEKTEDEDDIYNHIDYYLIKNGKKIGIDVKHLKDTKRAFIEFKNVRGNDGWMYGNANCICFIVGSKYVLVYRKELLEYMATKMNIKGLPFRMRPEEYYVMYGRSGRKDRYAMIPPKDLLNVKHLIWR